MRLMSRMKCVWVYITDWFRNVFREELYSHSNQEEREIGIFRCLFFLTFLEGRSVTWKLSPRCHLLINGQKRSPGRSVAASQPERTMQIARRRREDGEHCSQLFCGFHSFPCAAAVAQDTILHSRAETLNVSAKRASETVYVLTSLL